MQQLKISSTTKLVALMLATYSTAKNGKNVRPGIPRLAADCSLSERAVNTHLAKLRATRLIVRTANGSWGNQYALKADEYRLNLPDDLVDKGLVNTSHPALTDRYMHQVHAPESDDALVREPGSEVPAYDDRGTCTTFTPPTRTNHDHGSGSVSDVSYDRAREADPIDIEDITIDEHIDRGTGT